MRDKHRMTAATSTLLASFTTPLQIDTDPASMLWLIPLMVGIAVVYKATKVHKVKAWPFTKETAVLIGSIFVFVTVAALILHGVAWFVTEQLPALTGGSAF
jgi:hypothetical protein